MSDYTATEPFTALKVLKAWSVADTVFAGLVAFVYAGIRVPVEFVLSYEASAILFLIAVSTLLTALLFVPGSDDFTD
jgi:hypothetical protein